MTNAIDALETEALRLSPSERVQLLERLAASLPADPDIEQAWELEADRREAELAAGTVKAIPADEVLTRLRAKLR